MLKPSRHGPQGTQRLRKACHGLFQAVFVLPMPTPALIARLAAVDILCSEFSTCCQALNRSQHLAAGPGVCIEAAATASPGCSIGILHVAGRTFKMGVALQDRVRLAGTLGVRVQATRPPQQSARHRWQGRKKARLWRCSFQRVKALRIQSLHGQLPPGSDGVDGPSSHQCQATYAKQKGAESPRFSRVWSLGQCERARAKERDRERQRERASESEGGREGEREREREQERERERQSE